jgi:hypothetical protein
MISFFYHWAYAPTSSRVGKILSRQARCLAEEKGLPDELLQKLMLMIEIMITFKDSKEQLTLWKNKVVCIDTRTCKIIIKLLALTGINFKHFFLSNTHGELAQVQLFCN